MIKINVITVGKVKEKYFADGITEYTKRLNRFCEIKIVELKEENITDKPNDKETEIIKNKEGERILKELKGYVCVMAIEGVELSSEKLASTLQNLVSGGTGEISFVIGGSYGVADAVKQIADLKLSFSKMTFPHTMFRLMLVEQLYRAFMINAGAAYHK